VCVINEDLYHYDLDYPRTRIHDNDALVQLPSFSEAQLQSGDGQAGDRGTVVQCYFLAKAALRKVVGIIHNAIHLRALTYGKAGCER
jgi:hypothetical protein